MKYYMALPLFLLGFIPSAQAFTQYDLREQMGAFCEELASTNMGAYPDIRKDAIACALKVKEYESQGMSITPASAQICQAVWQARKYPETDEKAMKCFEMIVNVDFTDHDASMCRDIARSDVETALSCITQLGVPIQSGTLNAKQFAECERVEQKAKLTLNHVQEEIASGLIEGEARPKLEALIHLLSPKVGKRDGETAASCYVRIKSLRKELGSLDRQAHSHVFGSRYDSEPVSDLIEEIDTAVFRGLKL